MAKKPKPLCKICKKEIFDKQIHAVYCKECGKLKHYVNVQFSSLMNRLKINMPKLKKYGMSYNIKFIKIK